MNWRLYVGIPMVGMLLTSYYLLSIPTYVLRYLHNIKPQNPGFLPRLNAHFGQRYTVAATEALSEFQRLQLNQRAAKHQLEQVVDLQAGKGQPWDLVDRFVSSKKFCSKIVWSEKIER